MEWSTTTPQSSVGSSSPPPSPLQSTSALPQAQLLSAPQSLHPLLLQLQSTQSCPHFSLFIVKDLKTKDLEWYGFQIAENTNNPVNNIELPRSLPQGFVPFKDEPYHRNSNIPILKPNFICTEENGRHCSVTGTNSNFYRIPGQTLVKSSFIQLWGPLNLVYLHSLNPTVPIIEYVMPINVKDSHPIILDGILYCLGGCFPPNWACSMNIETGRWTSIPNPPYLPPNMSSVFSVGVKNPNPYIVVGYKDSNYPILQLLNVSTNQWSIRKFQLNLNDRILDPPTNQPVAVDSKFFWYDAVKQWVVGYNLFSGECYLAEVHTHDHGAGDPQARLAFLSGGDDGSLYFCLQWLSPTKINGSPMVKFHCLKLLLAQNQLLTQNQLLAQNQLPSGSTIFLDRKVLACQTFLAWGQKSFLDAMVGIGQLERPYLLHERQLES